MATTRHRDTIKDASRTGGAVQSTATERVSAASQRVTVEAAARLHLGFIDPDGSLGGGAGEVGLREARSGEVASGQPECAEARPGRRFGSIGLAVDQPVTRLTVRRSDHFFASGPEADRAVAAARRFSLAFAGGAPFRVDVAEAIPSHAGLGSGTQLALAIGTAILQLIEADCETPAAPANHLQLSAKLGAMAERGARSAIGIASFTGGGFIIDAGKSARLELAAAPPAVLMQIPFPDAWRAILIMDNAIEGVHGDAETAAFARLAPFGCDTSARIAHLVLMQLAPALHEADLPAFGEALTEIQARVGAYFAPAQGGSAWSSPSVGALARRLEADGATGIGQSSWGPTGFAFVSNEAHAENLYRSHLEAAKAQKLSLAIVLGRNTGASIT